MLNEMFKRKGQAYNADTGELMTAQSGWQDYIASMVDKVTGNPRFVPWGVQANVRYGEDPVKLDWEMILNDLINPRVPYMDFAGEPYRKRR